MGTASNVIVGVAELYIAPAGTPIPTLPATAGATSWPTPSAPWVPSGFTESGVVLNFDRKTTDIMVEELSTPVDVIDDTTTVTIDITFAEDTLQNQLNAYGGGSIATTAASASAPGYSTLTIADSLSQIAVVFYGVNTFGFQRQVYIPQMVSGGKVKTSYLRNKSARTYPATFTTICPVSSISIIDISAAVA